MNPTLPCFFRNLSGVVLLLVGPCAFPVCRAEAPKCSVEACFLKGPRGKLHLDVASLPAYARLKNLSPAKAFSGTYCVLTPLQCQCRAVETARLASLLEKEARLVIASSALKANRAANLQQVILTYSALEERNQAAGRSLELYFRLAEAEGKWDLLNATQQLVEEALQQIDKLKKQGLRVPDELEQFRTKGLDVKGDQLRLRAGLDQLNRHLGRELDLTGVPEQHHIWPESDFRVVDNPVDVEEAIAIGLAQRPQLLLLRHARANVDLRTLPAVRQLLKTSVPILGVAQSDIPLGRPINNFMAVVKGNEIGVRRGQLDEFLAQREREVADDIRQAAWDVEKQTHLAALAKERVEFWQTQVQEREAQFARGATTFVDVLAARLNHLKARGELLEAGMAWHLTQSKLRQAQGLLVADCWEDGAARCGE